MPKLNQIVALEKGQKQRTAAAITDIYHLLQKSQLFSGLSRVYKPKNEEGEQLPPESTNVQYTVEEQLSEIARELAKLIDIVATKEQGNMSTAADVKVGSKVIVPNASVPLLLFLEKQLQDFRTALGKVPVLDRAENWTPDSNAGNQWRTEPTMTVRTKKVPRNHVKAEATEKHPAQVEVYMEDITVGTWTATRFSGAIQGTRRNELLDRVNALLDAVKAAKEEANGIEVQQVKIANKMFDYLLGS
jgi:hypothetical protein